MKSLVGSVERRTRAAFVACLDGAGDALSDALAAVAATLWLARASRGQDAG